METGLVIDLVRQAILVTIIVSAPILIVSVVVGLIISVIQTTTSIQEQTLTFVPKIIMVLMSLVYFGYFIIGKMTDYTLELLAKIPDMVK